MPSKSLFFLSKIFENLEAYSDKMIFGVAELANIEEQKCSRLLSPHLTWPFPLYILVHGI